MKFKSMRAIALAGVLAASALTGCGINKDATVAVLGNQEIKLGVANFYARYQQASFSDYISYYASYYQYEDPWHEDLMSSGDTTENSIKSSVMETVHEWYTLKAHMDEYKVALTDEQEEKIKKAATDFMEANSEEALAELGATQEIVEEVLRLNTIQHMMREAIIADVDTNVSDAEANMRAYSIITIPIGTHYEADGSQKEYTDDEVQQMTAKAKEFVARAKSADDKTYEDLAKEYEYTASSATYDADNDTLDAQLKEALDGLKAGEDATLVTTDANLYIVKITAETDKEATENNRKSIISDRQDKKYNEVLSKWQEDDGWEIKEKVWSKVVFDDFFSTSTEEDTENGTEVGTEVEAETSTQ